MYGTTGVCQVMGITEEQFLDDEARDYYVLNPVYSHQTSRIKIPVQTQLNARYLHSKDEVQILLRRCQVMSCFGLMMNARDIKCLNQC